jgi:hypothetical protein
MEPSVISHPHKDHLFLVIEKSGVELEDDFLIPAMSKLEQISDTMQVTSLKNPVKVHVLLVPHILNIHKNESSLIFRYLNLFEFFHVTYKHFEHPHTNLRPFMVWPNMQSNNFTNLISHKYIRRIKIMI